MPEWGSELRRRLAPFNLAPGREAGIIDELSQHLDDRAAELRRAGMTDAAARRAALDELSDEELIDGGWRTVRRGAASLPAPGAPSSGFADSIRRDVAYAVRTLRRQPAFAIAAILALGLGIGATTAIFAAVDAVLLRPMPFPHADRLVVPVSENLSRNITKANVTFADYEDWRREPNLFAEVALYRPTAGDLTGSGDPERVRFATVTERFFALVDVTPIAGRTLVESDHAPGAPGVMVISETLWRGRFGGAADAVGRTVRLGGVAREIVGVVPARRVWPDTVAAFVPLPTATLNADVRTRRDNMIFGALARLKDGVSLDAARARASAIGTRLAQEYPESRKGWTNTVFPIREIIVSSELSLALYVLLGAVGAVLLIACANVANLALVRGSGRARELAVRLSLGASRRQLLQQLVIEGVVLAAAGALAGIGLSTWIMRGLVAIAPPGTPFLDDVSMNGRVLAAALGAAALAAIVAGLIPAVSASAIRVTAALREGSSGAGSSRHTARLRDVLVVAEIAAAIVLVTGSALLIRSFDRLSRVDPGVTVDRVAIGRISIAASRYPTSDRRVQFTRDLVARLEASADVECAALTSFVPAGGGGSGLGRVFLAEGQPEPPAAPDVGASWNVVTPNYFRVVGNPIAEGRAFRDEDDGTSTPVIVVSRTFVRRMFPNGGALGKRVRSWRDENVLREIVGIVEDVKYAGLADRERALIYVPYAQDPQGGMQIVVRGRGTEAAALGLTIRRAVAALDSELAVADVRTLASAASQSIAPQRYATLLLSILAAVALTLAALGIYGVTSYVFALRRREMGIRLALGADRVDVYRLVFRHGFGLTLAGLVFGLAGAAAVTHAMRALLFNTVPADPAAWLAMVAVVAVSTAVACLIPARRAAAADPTAALRAE